MLAKGSFLSRLFVTVLSTSLLIVGSEIRAENGVTFKDVAAGDGVGIDYRRVPSTTQEIWEALRQKDIYTMEDVALTPAKSRGAPGVALFDFDSDGDLDIYATNGPAAANSLYSNQLLESGAMEFIDVAAETGVDATDQDSAGVCFGDIDNDGDHDLYVLGKDEPNRLFENLGGSSFIEITLSSATGGGDNASSSCSFGDVNGDGLLDLAVANYFNTENRIPIMSLDHDELLQQNQLFVNQGRNTFEDESEGSGIQTVPGISWSLALVDYDLDGDADLFVADDQAARPPAHVGGRDAGLLRVYDNDGTGSFTDVTDDVNGGRFGAWMSLAFGDLNGDGYMDVFGSNIGDYMAIFMAPMLGFPAEPKEWNSGWFLGRGDGTLGFQENLGGLRAMPFGWGSATADYDNDGDLDIVFHGGLDLGPFVDASNPGAILRNDGQAGFTRDSKALAGSTDHTRRNVQGMTVGDLNRDGFLDIVSVSNMDWPKEIPLAPYFSDPAQSLGGPFDDTALMAPTFSLIDPSDLQAGFTWNGFDGVDGTLSIEINSADNGNRSTRIQLLGTKGLTTRGKVNRDGIGAVAKFMPENGRPTMKPLVSGGTYASSESLEAVFGINPGGRATVEILWPGGVRNRLYGVRADEEVLFPEIPCSFDDSSMSRKGYQQCVKRALYDLELAGVISHAQHMRFARSARKAYREANSKKHGKQIRFEDLSEQIRFSHESDGTEGLTGAAWMDYNNDGLLDLFLTNDIGHNNGLFRNEGDGSFTDVSVSAGIENGLGNTMALAGDIDNDGYVDLFLSNTGGQFSPIEATDVKLYRNNRDGTFSDITGQSGITGAETNLGAAFADINNDGFLDLYIAAPGSVVFQRQDRSTLYLNNGDLTFTDISASAGVDGDLGACAPAFSDYDLDGDQDLIVANCNDINLIPGPIQLYRNEGNLRFTDVTEEAGLVKPGAWMAMTVADYDNDGDQDLFSTSLGLIPGGTLPGVTDPLVFLPVLYENNGDGTFTDVTEQVGLSEPIWGWGATFRDFNNDGYVDLFHAGSFPFAPFLISGDLANPGKLYINNGDRTFTNHDSWLGVDLSGRYTSGVAAGDFDNNGFSDILVAVGSPSVDGTFTGERTPAHPVLLRNGGNRNHWVTIRTRGTSSNRSGIGTRVTIRARGLTQTKEVRAGSSFLSTQSPWLTFGLGHRRAIDSIEVHWASGLVERFDNVSIGETIMLVEGQGTEVDQ